VSALSETESEIGLPNSGGLTESPKPGKARRHRIELRLRDISQLFNSMDPSPFHEKDLDDDAEEFIVSWAQEFPRHDPVSLVIHLDQLPEQAGLDALVERAVRHFFAYRARLGRLEFRRLLKQARTSLLIGLAFLSSCLLASDLLSRIPHGPFLTVLTESLTIAGWVAMWRPLDMILYDWWPLRRKVQIFKKMSHMPVHLKWTEAAPRGRAPAHPVVPPVH
jgi:hypothetical protein